MPEFINRLLRIRQPTYGPLVTAILDKRKRNASGAPGSVSGTSSQQTNPYGLATREQLGRDRAEQQRRNAQDKPNPDYIPGLTDARVGLTHDIPAAGYGIGAFASGLPTRFKARTEAVKMFTHLNNRPGTPRGREAARDFQALGLSMEAFRADRADVRDHPWKVDQFSKKWQDRIYEAYIANNPEGTATENRLRTRAQEIRHEGNQMVNRADTAVGRFGQATARAAPSLIPSLLIPGGAAGLTARVATRLGASRAAAGAAATRVGLGSGAATAFAQGGGHAAVDGSDIGRTIVHGLAEMVPSPIPLRRFLKIMKDSSPAQIAGLAGAEGAQEMVTALLQNGYDFATKHPNATQEDWLGVLGDSIYEGGIGAVLGGGLGGATVGVDRLRQRAAGGDGQTIRDASQEPPPPAIRSTYYSDR